MKTTITILMLVFVHTSTYAGDKPAAYLCIPDYAIGYSNSKGSWQPARFSTDGEKYILKRFSNPKWRWYEFGDDLTDLHEDIKCDGYFDEAGFIDCTYYEDEIRFNNQSLRFMMINKYGYVMSGKPGPNEKAWITPSMRIGTCTPL